MTDLEPDYRKFAKWLFEESAWPGGDIDGGTFQDIAVACGLLKPETRHAPCGEGCSCAEYCDSDDFADGVTCYRKHEDLK